MTRALSCSEWKSVSTGDRMGGFEIRLRSFPGALATRVVHPPNHLVEAHEHDWDSIIIPVIGLSVEHCDAGETVLEGAAAIHRPGGSAHQDQVGGEGAEGIAITFDRAWLRLSGARSLAPRTLAAQGGRAGAAGRRLAACWIDPATPEKALAEETARFIATLALEPTTRRPRWFEQVSRAVDPADAMKTIYLAGQLGLNQAWLARAYRAAAGEGLHETLRRKRVERAVFALRATALPLAQVAIAAGFCDQSHMNRNFQSLLGRSPLQVRREGKWAQRISPNDVV